MSNFAKTIQGFAETMLKLDAAAGVLYDYPTLDNVRTVVQLVFPQHQVIPNETGDGFTVRNINFVALFESPQMFSDVLVDQLYNGSDGLYEAVSDTLGSGEAYAESTAIYERQVA